MNDHKKNLHQHLETLKTDINIFEKCMNDSHATYQALNAQAKLLERHAKDIRDYLLKAYSSDERREETPLSKILKNIDYPTKKH